MFHSQKVNRLIVAKIFSTNFAAQTFIGLAITLFGFGTQPIFKSALFSLLGASAGFGALLVQRRAPRQNLITLATVQFVSCALFLYAYPGPWMYPCIFLHVFCAILLCSEASSHTASIVLGNPERSLKIQHLAMSLSWLLGIALSPLLIEYHLAYLILIVEALVLVVSVPIRRLEFQTSKPTVAGSILSVPRPRRIVLSFGIIPVFILALCLGVFQATEVASLVSRFKLSKQAFSGIFLITAISYTVFPLLLKKSHFKQDHKPIQIYYWLFILSVATIVFYYTQRLDVSLVAIAGVGVSTGIVNLLFNRVVQQSFDHANEKAGALTWGRVANQMGVFLVSVFLLFLNENDPVRVSLIVSSAILVFLGVIFSYTRHRVGSRKPL